MDDVGGIVHHNEPMVAFGAVVHSDNNAYLATVVAHYKVSDVHFFS